MNFFSVNWEKYNDKRYLNKKDMFESQEWYKSNLVKNWTILFVWLALIILGLFLSTANFNPDQFNGNNEVPLYIGIAFAIIGFGLFFNQILILISNKKIFEERGVKSTTVKNKEKYNNWKEEQKKLSEERMEKYMTNKKNNKNTVKSKKIFSFDLDYTLLSEDNKVRKDDALSIKKIETNGDYSLINTGRHYIRAIEAAKNSNIRYIIGFNGTTLWDNKDKKEIFNNYLSRSAVENMIKYAEANEHLIGFWLKNKVVLMDFSSDGHQYKDYYRDQKKWTELMPEIVKKYTDKKDINDIIGDFQDNVYKIQLIFERKEWQKNRFIIEKELNQLHNKDATVFMGSLPDIEVCVSDTSKSIGLERFIKEMKIRDSETYAFGDGYNDIEILEYVDNAYVMSSATSREVIKLADEILEYDTGSIGRKIESIYNN